MRISNWLKLELFPGLWLCLQWLIIVCYCVCAVLLSGANMMQRARWPELHVQYRMYHCIKKKQHNHCCSWWLTKVSWLKGHQFYTQRSVYYRPPPPCWVLSREKELCVNLHTWLNKPWIEISMHRVAVCTQIYKWRCPSQDFCASLKLVGFGMKSKVNIMLHHESCEMPRAKLILNVIT